MSKEKQIAEIARDFNKGVCSDREFVESCTECAGVSEHCFLYKIATRLYNAGYRKQSEVIKDVLEKAASKFACHSDYHGDTILQVLYCMAEGKEVDNAKPLDAKQGEGEWVKYPHNSGIYCSLCKHKRRYRDINDAYCPNCGAHMKGGDKE